MGEAPRAHEVRETPRAAENAHGGSGPSKAACGAEATRVVVKQKDEVTRREVDHILVAKASTSAWQLRDSVSLRPEHDAVER